MSVLENPAIRTLRCEVSRMKTTLTFLACATLFAAASFAKDTKIPLAELPPQITEAVMRAHPTATLLNAEVDTKPDGTIENYEVEVNDAGKKFELKLLPDGTIQKQDD